VAEEFIPQHKEKAQNILRNEGNNRRPAELHNKGSHNLYATNNIAVMKPGTMKSAGE
jgi:hypothetical protein